jgi:phospholipase D1/2
VASYNVHGCVGSDGRLDVARVARVIGELDADAVGLQEVYAYGATGTRQLAQLARLAGMHPVAGVTLRRERAEYGNALLLRDATLVAARRRDLSVLPHEPRGALAVEVGWRERRLHLVVAHLGLRAAERRRQVHELIRWLESYVAQPELPTLLMGDLNEWRPWVRPLREIAAHLRPGPRVRSFPARLPVLPLDRMYVAGDARLVQLRAHRSRLARRASDHLPVSAWLEIGGNPGS